MITASSPTGETLTTAAVTCTPSVAARWRVQACAANGTLISRSAKTTRVTRPQRTPLRRRVAPPDALSVVPSAMRASMTGGVVSATVDDPDPAYGVFDTLLVRDGRAVDLDAHLGRLRRSVLELYAVRVDADELAARVLADGRRSRQGAGAHVVRAGRPAVGGRGDPDRGARARPAHPRSAAPGPRARRRTSGSTDGSWPTRARATTSWSSTRTAPCSSAAAPTSSWCSAARSSRHRSTAASCPARCGPGC